MVDGTIQSGVPFPTQPLLVSACYACARAWSALMQPSTLIATVNNTQKMYFTAPASVADILLLTVTAGFWNCKKSSRIIEFQL